MTSIHVSVRMKGLEPPRLSALDPKSSAATNYATSAIMLRRYTFLIVCTKNPFCREEVILFETSMLIYQEIAIKCEE